jgi:L-ascorbate metabolism protein UlaG (beta-lactamase superfamily)
VSNRPLTYLKPNVQVEPLIDSWYAWPQLIPPVTSARNLTERQFPIMESYVAAPHIHRDAVRNPELQGGPFIDYPDDRVDDIRSLMARTRSARPHLFELSAAIADLDRLLAERARGFCLHDLYPAIPPPLQGYVELVYDLSQQPSFRFYEPLLYRSKYYDRDRQSLMLSLTTADDRPFVMSTPRLPFAGAAQLHRAFDDPSIDALFRLSSVGVDAGAVAELMNGTDGAWEHLFTTTAPRPYQAYAGRGVRWRYFGHACILIETGGVSCLFDPILSYTYESGLSRYTYRDLPPEIDYVCITHTHTDHVLFETLLQLRHRVRNIIVPKTSSGAIQDPSIALILKNTGFANVHELAEYDTIQCGPMSITGVPFVGEHCDVNIQAKLAYLVRTARRSMMFAADTQNIERSTYRHVHRDLGDVDALFIGMECDGAPLSWLFQPLIFRSIERAMDHSRRFAGSDFEQVWAMVEQFRCKEVYVYAMGQEPWLNYILTLKYTSESRPITESNRLLAACAARGIVAERLFGEKEILIEG